MRPSDFTTLEAIDLANGETLAAAIEKGVKQWRPSSGQTASDVMNRLYLSALARPPTADELAAATAVLDKELPSEAVQDVLWSILMLPEFQLVR